MRLGRSGYIARLLVCDSRAKVGDLILASVDKTEGVVRGEAMQGLAHVQCAWQPRGRHRPAS